MKKQQRILAIDYGLARIGMALSDATRILATPLPTLKAEKKLEQTVTTVTQCIQKIEKDKDCVLIEVVIGLPLLLSGKDGVMADETRLFASKLQEKIHCHITLWDERFTSVQAERSLKEAKLSRKKRAQAVDAVAAVLLLQSYLDSKQVDP